VIEWSDYNAAAAKMFADLVVQPPRPGENATSGGTSARRGGLFECRMIMFARQKEMESG
jgi:hypothetical protein